MNLVEARKLGHNGWVRSLSRTNNIWCYLKNGTWESPEFKYRPDFCAEDLDAEDWEPKKAFEAEVWFHPVSTTLYINQPTDNSKEFEEQGWKKIKVKEVLD